MCILFRLTATRLSLMEWNLDNILLLWIPEDSRDCVQQGDPTHMKWHPRLWLVKSPGLSQVAFELHDLENWSMMTHPIPSFIWTKIYSTLFHCLHKVVTSVIQIWSMCHWRYNPIHKIFIRANRALKYGIHVLLPYQVILPARFWW